MDRQSIATIDSPEFINLEPLDISPTISKCEIKVLYIGKNRNGTVITKEVATKMAASLRGVPIVGYFNEEHDDFRDHGDQVIFDGDGVHFNCLTVPYGFIAPDAKIWFQTFEDTDEFGNTIVREYLMTTGYLWTQQFKEAQKIITEGRPQSMEINSDMDGHWAEDYNSGLEFFIIDDANFLKLCILGEDVEPCFEGANITKPVISKTFTRVDNDFKNTLYSMMQDLKFALEGGKPMEDKLDTMPVETPDTSTVDYVATDAKESGKAGKKTAEPKENKDAAPKDADKSALIEQEQQLAELQEKYTALEAKYDELVEANKALNEFKLQVEDEKKEQLIDSFYMLSDEDKKEVRENKAQYSLDDIEAKLSVICVRKKVNFDLDKPAEVEQEVAPATTYALTPEEASAPAWIMAVRNTQSR